MKQKEAIEATKREHELELAHLGEGHNVAERSKLREDRAKPPKLPSFVDGKDDLDAYLQRFERFATTAKWEKKGWASKLSALIHPLHHKSSYLHNEHAIPHTMQSTLVPFTCTQLTYPSKFHQCHVHPLHPLPLRQQSLRHRPTQDKGTQTL